MVQILMILLLIVSIAMIGVILIQRGKGADMGASFGAGASGTVFGSAGSGNFLTRTTAILAVLFFAIALGLTYLGSRPAEAPTDDILSGDEIPTEISTELPGATAEDLLQSEEIPADIEAAIEDADVPADLEPEPAADEPDPSGDNQ